MADWAWENFDSNKLAGNQIKISETRIGKGKALLKSPDIGNIGKVNEAGVRTKNAEIVCNNVIEESYDFSGGEGSAKAHLKIGTKRRKRAEVTVDEVASNKQKKVEEEIPKTNIKNTPKEDVLVQHRCIFCGFVFRGNPELKLHMDRYQDSDQNFICPQSDCHDKFSRKDTFKVHMNKHNGNSIVCTDCGKLFFSDTILKAHMREKANRRNVNCEQCPQVFRSKEGLQRHVQMHDIEREFPCDKCNLRFEEQFVLRRHIKLSHEQITEMVKCTLCEKKFKIKHSLQQHTRLVHNKEKNHGCTECGSKFFSRSKLTRHVNSKHTQ